MRFQYVLLCYCHKKASIVSETPALITFISLICQIYSYIHMFIGNFRRIILLRLKFNDYHRLVSTLLIYASTLNRISKVIISYEILR